MIGLFLSEEVPRGLSFAETVERIHAQGGLVYMPHPFDRMHSIPSPETLRRHVDQIDMLETSNGRLYFETDNDEAERFAERYGLLAARARTPTCSRASHRRRCGMPRLRRARGVPARAAPAEIVRRSRNLLYLQGLKWVRQLRPVHRIPAAPGEMNGRVARTRSTSGT